MVTNVTVHLFSVHNFEPWALNVPNNEISWLKLQDTAKEKNQCSFSRLSGDDY